MSAVAQAPLNSVTNSEFEGEDFVYRPIPLLVPISMGFVFLSLSAALMAELIAVPVLGVILSAIAYRQIRVSGGNLSGGWLALGSLVTQCLMVVAFSTMHVYSYATEVPPGFDRVSFGADISKKGFAVEGGIQKIHPDVKKLVGQKVMIKGYMYPTKAVDGLTSFVLCRDNGDCCFGGQPKTTDMILINMKGDNHARFRQGLVAVAGVFRAEQTVDETGLQPVYQLDCDFFGPAKTWY
jgi:hypothetical protein